MQLNKFVLSAVGLCLTEYVPQGGPVYINPNAAASQLLSESQTQNGGTGHITQTVYGFLDFTTTIGNTVMVFSPQSSAPGNFYLIMWISFLDNLRIPRNLVFFLSC